MWRVCGLPPAARGSRGSLCRVAFGRLLLFLLLSGVSVAFAANPSGTVVDVNQNAKATGSEGARVLLSQGAVFSGDEITTDYKGIAQIIFVDNTRFVIGPNSRTIIDRFIFNPDNTARAVTISATKGAFRFITGVSPHQAYNIRTPAMTIGVRGTNLDFSVEAGTGRVTEALYSGGTTNCEFKRCMHQCGRHLRRRHRVTGWPGVQRYPGGAARCACNQPAVCTIAARPRRQVQSRHLELRQQQQPEGHWPDSAITRVAMGPGRRRRSNPRVRAPAPSSYKPADARVR